MRSIVLAVVLLPLIPACRSEEGRQVAGAVETFIDFGMSNEERAKAPPKKRGEARPHLPERSREVKHGRRERSILWVELDMPHGLGGDEVVAALDYEVDRLLSETDHATMEIRGMPAGLLTYGSAMGGATVRRTNEEGVIERRVWSRVRDDQPTLTPEQYQALVALELAIAGAGRGGKAKALRQTREVHGRQVVDGAIRAARRRWSGRSKGR